MLKIHENTFEGIDLVVYMLMWLNAIKQPQNIASSLPTDLILKSYGTCCWSVLAWRDFYFAIWNYKFDLKVKKKK